MKYLLIAICAATMLSTSALAGAWKGESGKDHRGYEGRGYLAYNYGGGYTTTSHSSGYAPAYYSPRSRIVFHERCSFTNDPSC
jgi:hypothetical protein